MGASVSLFVDYNLSLQTVEDGFAGEAARSVSSGRHVFSVPAADCDELAWSGARLSARSLRWRRRLLLLRGANAPRASVLGRRQGITLVFDVLCVAVRSRLGWHRRWWCKTRD